MLLARCWNTDVWTLLAAVSVLGHGTPVHIDDHEEAGEKHAGTKAEPAAPVAPPGCPRIDPTIDVLSGIVLPRLSGGRLGAEMERSDHEKQAGSPEAPSTLYGKEIPHVIGGETTDERE